MYVSHLYIYIHNERRMGDTYRQILVHAHHTSKYYCLSCSIFPGNTLFCRTCRTPISFVFSSIFSLVSMLFFLSHFGPRKFYICFFLWKILLDNLVVCFKLVSLYFTPLFFYLPFWLVGLLFSGNLALVKSHFHFSWILILVILRDKWDLLYADILLRLVWFLCFWNERLGYKCWHFAMFGNFAGWVLWFKGFFLCRKKTQSGSLIVKWSMLIVWYFRSRLFTWLFTCGFRFHISYFIIIYLLISGG